MKKSYKIDVDCANCANLMEEATKKTAGVKDCTVSFMTLKMKVEFEDGTWNVPLGIAGDRLLYAARDGSFRLMELSDPSQEIVFSLPEMAES